MDVRVLGAIEVREPGSDAAISVGGPRQRRILAALVMNSGSVVSIDRLVNLVWSGDEVPAQAERNVRTYVHRIRQAVGEDMAQLLTTSLPGYVLDFDGVEVDAGRFDELLGQSIWVKC